MKTSRSTWGVMSALTFAGLALGAQPSHAVMLEQKWQAGSQLNYDMVVQGNAVLQTNAPNFPLANVPIPIKLNGDGTFILDTRSVDAKGTGTVSPKLAPFTVHAEAFNQQFEIRLTNTAVDVMWNGQRAGGGPTPTVPLLQVSRLGKLEGIVPPAPANGTAAPAGGDNPQPNAPAAARDPFSGLLQGGMLQNALTQAFPAFWPGRDIQEGETWTVNVPRPVTSQAAAAPAATVPAQPATTAAAVLGAPDPNSLGQFTLTLGPQEAVGERQARRVAVEGTLRYAPAAPAANTPAPANGAGRVADAQQHIKGNLWFDPELGQIVRAELDVQAGLRGNGINVGITAPGAPANGAAQTNSGGSLDFTGTIQVQLKSVTQQPATP